MRRLLATLSLFLFVGCASHGGENPTTATSGSETKATAPGYDDQQIAKIRAGETGEAQLVERFGSPESRDVKPDGRAELRWNFSRRTDGGGGHSGRLDISLAPDGKVEGYNAAGGPLLESRTVDIVQKSDTDFRQQINAWQMKGWSVVAVSKPRPEPDGTVHRKANLSYNAFSTTNGIVYDDHRIAGIRHGETTATQLVEWFGPAYKRALQPDGRLQLAWNFAPGTDAELHRSGELIASVAANGKVDSYSAHRRSD